MCREEGLTIRPRRKVKAKVDVPRTQHSRATRVNECWTLDFVSDQLESGKRLRFLNVVDECTRECLLCWPEFTFKSMDVVMRLEALVKQRGQAPSRLRSDNGSEFVAAACTAWLQRHSVEHVRSRPGKPTDNPMVESFNSRFRDECLDRQLFSTLKDASTVTDAYRREYNEVRPHSALKYRTPVEYRQSLQRRPAGLS
jgi:putative transposase